MKKATITGINGFLGSSLNKRLLSMDWETYPMLREDVDYVFLFGSASSNRWYQHALSYNIRETIEGFLNAADFCKEHDIKLIYPSSGTVYEGKNAYSKCKLILESLASLYPKNLGLRIFATYGPGERHKGEYASTLYQFAKDMKMGKRPVIWGDGTQSRDFIYIDDVIDQIILNKSREGIIEIGSGVNWSLNELVEIINKRLKSNIKPVYVQKPQNYIETTICKKPCRCRVSIKEGIQKVIDSI